MSVKLCPYRARRNDYPYPGERYSMANTNKMMVDVISHPRRVSSALSKKLHLGMGDMVLVATGIRSVSVNSTADRKVAGVEVDLTADPPSEITREMCAQAHGMVQELKKVLPPELPYTVRVRGRCTTFRIDSNR
ncbi:MAG: hypothetical protein Q8P99_01530 [bacterium]|nr:hypothetical protein [bacterium]